ncbi:MAG: CYTH domain-containing protein [Nitrospira sp.]|nr:CYTH domain-containing protein [Nitrospira sp.]
MASLYECEVRFLIEDISAFEKKLGVLGAVLIYPYEFNDHYFKPDLNKWNPSEKNIRIREWKFPQNETTVYFSKNEVVSIEGVQFKRALYSQGKVPLFSGDINTCKSLLHDLGFSCWFTIEKQQARFWEIAEHGFKTAAEFIEGLGWCGELEFEGEDPMKAKADIERSLKILEIPNHLVSYEPLSVIFSRQVLGFL